MLTKSFFQMLFARLDSGELAFAKEALAETSTSATPTTPIGYPSGLLCALSGTPMGNVVESKVRAIKALRRILHLDLRDAKDLIDGIHLGKPCQIRLLPADIAELQAALLIVQVLEKPEGPSYMISGSFIGAAKDVLELHRLIVVRALSRALKKTRIEVEDLIAKSIDHGTRGILAPNLTKEDREDIARTGLRVLYSAATDPANGHMYSISGSFRDGMGEEAAKIFCNTLRITEDEAQALLVAILREGVMICDLSQEDRAALSRTGLLVVPQGIFVGPPSPFPWPQ